MLRSPIRSLTSSLIVVLALVLGAGSAQAAKSKKAAAPNATQTVMNDALAKYKDIQEGKNADYIPALAKVDPNIYGIAVVTTDGKVYTVGDVKSEVSIQSISKVFAMAKVMEEQGPDAILNNMGVDATGQVFNSITAIEQYKGSEMNPMVNPGAITTTSMISGATPDEIWGKIMSIHNDCAGRQLSCSAGARRPGRIPRRSAATRLRSTAFPHARAATCRLGADEAMVRGSR